MKLRKVGDEIKIPLDEAVKRHGEAHLAAQVAALRAQVEAGPPEPVSRPAGKKRAPSDRQRARDLISASHTVALEQLQKRVEAFDGVALVVGHLGYAEKERLRLEAQRADLANERELAVLRSQHPAEQWPALYKGEVETADMTARALAYQRDSIKRSALRLVGLEDGDITDAERIADVLMGLGIGDIVVKEIIDANSPTAAQVF